MTSVILMYRDNIDLLYQQTMEYFNQRYCRFPTNLIDIPISEEEASEMSYYNGMADYAQVNMEAYTRPGGFQAGINNWHERTINEPKRKIYKRRG
jgi:hypothetical protein